MAEIELLLRSMLHQGADFWLFMKDQDPKQLAGRMGLLAVVLLTAYATKSLWKGYKHNFKFSKEPVYIGSRKLAGAGGWGGLLLLPTVLVETVLMPLYLLLGCFAPRSEAEKSKDFDEKRDVASTLKRHKNLQDNLNSRIMELEEETARQNTRIHSLTLDLADALSLVKKMKLAEQKAGRTYSSVTPREPARRKVYPASVDL